MAFSGESTFNPKPIYMRFQPWHGGGEVVLRLPEVGGSILCPIGPNIKESLSKKLNPKLLYEWAVYVNAVCFGVLFPWPEVTFSFISLHTSVLFQIIRPGNIHTN